MALTNMALKTKNWSHLGEEETVEKKKRRGRGRREEEEEEIKQKGMETHLDYEFYEIWHGSLVLYDSYLA